MMAKLHIFISVTVLVLLGHHGCCAAADPVLQLDPFTSTTACPASNKDHIRGTVFLDLTGVTLSDYIETVMINPHELARGKFNPCGVISPRDSLLCVSDDGNEHYVFNFTQPAEKRYSGGLFRAMLYDTFLVGFSNSSLQRYPLIKHAPVQIVSVDNEDYKVWQEDYDVTLWTGNTSQTLRVVYNVTGIQWTENYRVSVLDKSMNELEFSTTSIQVVVDIPAPTSTTEFYVSYFASPHPDNACRQTTRVIISDMTENTLSATTTATTTTTTTTTTATATTDSAVKTVPDESSNGLEFTVTPARPREQADKSVQFSCTPGKDTGKYRDIFVMGIKKGEDTIAVLLAGLSRVNMRSSNDLDQRLQAKGLLSKSGDLSRSYLNLTLMTPVMKDSGDYACYVSYARQDGTLTADSKTVSLKVQDAGDTTEFLEKTVSYLEKRLETLENQIKDMQASCCSRSNRRR